MFFTSALSSNHQGFLRFTPAHSSASGEAKPVGLLRGQSGDGELASIGAHLHCSPSLGVPAVETVGYLVAWQKTGEKTEGTMEMMGICEKCLHLNLFLHGSQHQLK